MTKMLIPKNSNLTVETEVIRSTDLAISSQRRDRIRLPERGAIRNSGRRKTCDRIGEVENAKSDITTERPKSVNYRPSYTRRLRRLNIDRNATITLNDDRSRGSKVDQKLVETASSDDDKRILAIMAPRQCPQYSDEQSLFRSPDSIVRTKPLDKFLKSKKVAELSNQPNLKFAFENAMLPKKTTSHDEKKVLTEHEKLPSFSIQNMEKPLGIDPTSSFRTPDILTMKKPVLKSKKPSAVVHTPPQLIGCKEEVIIDRTDYSGNNSIRIPRIDIRKKLKQIKTRGLISKKEKSSSSSSSVSSPSSGSNLSGAPPLFFSPLTRAPRGGSGLKDDEDFFTPRKGQGFSPPKVRLNQLYGGSNAPQEEKGDTSSTPQYAPRPAREKKLL